jgi:hypothetical protein
VPEVGEVYIDNLRQQVTGLHKHADEQAEIIKHYVDLSNNLQIKTEQLEQRNARLEAKLLVKVKGAVKRRVKWLKG